MQTTMKNLILLCFLATSLSAFAMPQDSIGVKVVDGKTYIMHKVSKGEGVYGIGKKYGVPAADIFAANDGSKTSIKIDQILLIPKTGLTATGSGSGAGKGTSATSNNSTVSKSEKTYHTVAAGQTLSLIARKYNTTVAEIKSLNNLKSDNIALGQKLIVAETKTTVAQSTPKPVETPKPETKPEPVTEPVVKTPDAVVAPPVVSNNNVVVSSKTESSESSEKSSQVINTYSTDDGDEISESGSAIISNDGELSQERSFIMHPTAKVGTIVMIINTSNNNTVFARVVANCKCDAGTILKMSKTVASKLGVNDTTQVKLSYAK